MLKEKLAKGEKLLIIGPDGLSNPETELTKEILLKLVNDPQIIFGHELVLCSLLLGHKVWEM